jgi:steroid 5-alpha reductase family enzyme
LTCAYFKIVRCQVEKPGIFMTVFYLEALAAIAVSLAVLMAFAWVVQQRTGNSGWVDTIWTFSLGLVGAGSALWPVADGAPNARQWLVAALVAIWSLRLGTHIAVRTAGTTDDPRYAAFAKAWGRTRRADCSSSAAGRADDPFARRSLS